VLPGPSRRTGQTDPARAQVRSFVGFVSRLPVCQRKQALTGGCGSGGKVAAAAAQHSEHSGPRSPTCALVLPHNADLQYAHTGGVRDTLGRANAAAPAPRSGAEALKALLTQLYQTRAAAYRDSVRAFIEGYAEGRAAPPASWEDALGPQPGAQAPAAPSGLSTSETGGAGAPPGRAAGRGAGGAGSSGAASAARGGGPAGAGRGGAAGAAGGESAQGSEAAAACDNPGAASPSGAGAASGVRHAAGGDDRAAVPPHAGGRPGRGERQGGGAAGTSAAHSRPADSGAGGATGAHADAAQRHGCAGQAASEGREQEPPRTAAE